MAFNRLIPAPLAAKFTGGGTGGLAFFAIALQQAGSLAVTLLAARFLLPAEFGVYAVAAIFMLFLQELTYTGVSHFIVTQEGDEDRLLSTTFWLIFGFSTLAAGTLFIAAPLIAWLFDAPDLALILRLMAVVQPFGTYISWSAAILQRRQKMRLHFQLVALQGLAGLIGGVAILIAWQSIFALVLYRYLVMAVGVLGHLLFVREMPGFRTDTALGRRILGYAGNLYGTRSLQFFSNYGADLVLGAFLSTASAGIYRLGNRLGVVPMELIGFPVRTFALSQFGQANRAGRAISPIVQSLVSTMTFLMGCMGAVVAVFGDEIVTVVFQPAYMAAIPIAVALIVRSLVGIGDSLLGPMLAAADKTRLLFHHRLIWDTSALALILVVAQFGGIVVAWSLAALKLGASIRSVILGVRHCGLDWRAIVRGLLRGLAFVAAFAATAAAIRAGAAFWLGEPLWVLVVGGAGTAVAGGVILLVSLKAHVTDLSIFISK